MSLFRVYENGAPAKIEHFLKWSANGAADGELVFVSGNPGRTQRIFTTAALKYLRDHRMPFVLNFLRRREILLQQFGLESDEAKRRAQDELFGMENSRKAYLGMIEGLQNPQFLARKQQQEEKLLGRLRSETQLAPYATAWDSIADVQTRRVDIQGMTPSFLRDRTTLPKPSS